MKTILATIALIAALAAPAEACIFGAHAAIRCAPVPMAWMPPMLVSQSVEIQPQVIVQPQACVQPQIIVQPQATVVPATPPAPACVMPPAQPQAVYQAAPAYVYQSTAFSSYFAAPAYYQPQAAYYTAPQPYIVEQSGFILAPAYRRPLIGLRLGVRL